MSYIMPLYKKLYDLNHSKFFHRRLDNFELYINKVISSRTLIPKALGMSLLMQIMNTFSFVFIICSINPGKQLDILELVFLVPIGIFFMLLPISVAGLGVGNLAFLSLLLLVGIQNGSDVFTIFFAFSYIFNLMGIIPFFVGFRRTKKTIP